MTNLENDPFIAEKRRFRSRQVIEFAALVGGAVLAQVGVVTEVDPLLVVGLSAESGSILSMLENSLRHDRILDSLNSQAIRGEI